MKNDVKQAVSEMIFKALFISAVMVAFIAVIVGSMNGGDAMIGWGLFGVLVMTAGYALKGKGKGFLRSALGSVVMVAGLALIVVPTLPL